MKKKWPTDLSTEEKIKAAEEKIEAAINNVMATIQVNAANEIINHSDKLSSQVPYSYAGNAYRVFANEMMRGEVLRLCTLWDNVGKGRNSLPTIAKLIDDDEVHKELWNRALSGRGHSFEHLTEHDDPDFQTWGHEQKEAKIAEDTFERFSEPFKNSIKSIEEARVSEPISTMLDHRNVFLAHSLDKRSKQFPDRATKAGDAKKVLLITMEHLETISMSVRGSSFDWEGSFEIAKRNAQALWHRVTIDVLE